MRRRVYISIKKLSDRIYLLASLCLQYPNGIILFSISKPKFLILNYILPIDLLRIVIPRQRLKWKDLASHLPSIYKHVFCLSNQLGQANTNYPPSSRRIESSNYKVMRIYLRKLMSRYMLSHFSIHDVQRLEIPQVMNVPSQPSKKMKIVRISLAQNNLKILASSAFVAAPGPL